ncbi:MAG: hypothetical protein AUI92_03265 [Thaumarchaeota archaeon 13_1_40CM_3_38_6]|nr:MAG: hypothetical protein AUI92_03265 [Thaumarchaeota archaeon 13_1_40CM_3_38_6]
MRYDTVNEKTFSVCNKIGMSRLETSKKELTRINWKIVRRIVTFLHYNNRMKKTNIAMRCAMSYDRFIRYLDWMRSIDLVKKELDGGRVELISLSEKGIDLYQSNFKDMVNLSSN